MNKCDKKEEENKHLSVSDIEEYFPSLHSKYILPKVVSLLNSNGKYHKKNINANNNKLRIEILNIMIKILKHTLDHGSMEYHTLCLNMNRELLLNGYIRSNINIFIPSDIIKCIYQFYSYSTIWNIKDKEMIEFMTAGNKSEDIHTKLCGPIIDVNGISFRLTLEIYLFDDNYRTHEWLVFLYFEVINTMPQKSVDIQTITFQLFVYWKEIDSEFRTTICYDPQRNTYNIGFVRRRVKPEWISMVGLWSEIIEQKFNSFHIEMYDKYYSHSISQTK